LSDPEVPWNEYWLIKAVTWLSLKVKKPILRLTSEDYEDNGLGNLVAEVGNDRPEAVNLRVFKII
jgi:glucosamine-6-phosphate deaminase